MTDEFTCSNCGHKGDPAETDSETVVGYCWIRCAECGRLHLVKEAYADARIEEHRERQEVGGGGDAI